MLDGFRTVDEHFRSAPFEQNLPALMGLLGVSSLSQHDKSYISQAMPTNLPGDVTTTVAVDPRGIVTSTVGQTDPVPGQDVVTNLDARVQSAAETA